MTKRYNANLTSVGLATMYKSPVCEDFSKIEADVAFLGIPYDGGVGYRPGCRFGPSAMREYSKRFTSWGGANPAGYWDLDAGERLLDGVKMVDCGDVDIAYYDFERNFGLITGNIEAILDADALPVMIGGDHSVTYPCIRAFSRFEKLDVIHIDAHLDWIDNVDGVRYASGSPLRRSKELPFVRNMTHIGIRDVRTREEDWNDLHKRGASVITRKMIRDNLEAALARIPEMSNVYVTIDIDGMDPSIAPGTGSPCSDGLLYHELKAILQDVTKKGRVVGLDLVEINPLVDLEGQTSLMASTFMLEFLGAIFKARRP
ncbi:agmatinase [Mesorhizobium sp. J18]|uniref:agmatinase n=1 Tax=Mesorhizobium sp. J18 TaxID=935263 RepID=UPI00119AB5D0|nr:agmatinase [Mesorhizobium sp. J18]TWG94235.1 agmatinase [Mesorhizobium sp. J18]